LIRFVVRLTQHELSQDPNDYFANRLLHFGSTLTPSTVRFAALYLLLHGIVESRPGGGAASQTIDGPIRG
jgi:uncharacterized membrane protein